MIYAVPFTMDPKLELKSRINNPFFDSPERNTLFCFAFIGFSELNTPIFLKYKGVAKGVINKLEGRKKEYSNCHLVFVLLKVKSSLRA